MAETWALAAKGEKSDIKKKPDQDRQNLTCKVSLNNILKLGKKDEKKPVILAPLVKVTPDIVDKETRTRQRYAVVAGLIESGYRPQEPRLLHFCSIQTGSLEYDMRWEHYSHESKDNAADGSTDKSEDKPDIVVTWIDSEILTAENKPGHPCTDSCNFAFKNLLKELCENNKFYLFDLNNILGHVRSKQVKNHIKCINEKNECGKKENIKLIKPAGMEGETGNEELASKLAEELKLRGIKDTSELIIIREQGSESAAKLVSNVRQSLGESFAKQGEIRNVFYLNSPSGNPRKTDNQDKKEKNETPADKVENVPVIDLNHSPQLPVGSGQLDYFHRLAEELKNAHDTVDFDKRDMGVKAAVILGSNFNDKSLIIEALREAMPHLLILTNELDAQMLHRKHWRSTRNLVVASHFDLLLREKPDDDENKNDKINHFWQRSYQNQFPPFRDSQQTNIFYRTLSIAAGDAQGIEDSEITFPRIFEVGRNGFVRLGTSEKNNNLGYHPPNNTQENNSNQLLLLALIAASLVVFHWSVRPWSRFLSSYLFLTIAIFAIAFGFGIDVFSTNESGEPFSFTDGVSLWPTLFIQIIAIFLAGMFFVQAICELEGNSCRLSARYFLNDPPSFPACPGECELWARRRWHSLGPWLEDLSGSRWIPSAVLILIGTIIVYAWNDVYPSHSLPFWRCIILLGGLAIIYLAVVGSRDNVSIKHWMEADNWGLPDQVNHESVLWQEYCSHGQLGPRIARVVWIWLIFAIIETLLVYLLPPWPLPWRDAADPASRNDMAPWIGVLSFTIVMLLLFFILDAVRLNFCWIKKLRTQQPLLIDKLPDPFSPILRRRLEKMVLLVAERTQAVDKLIYYPMFCIMLMLFAKVTYFDNQEFPLSKGITFGAAISFLFLSGFVLRLEANELKLSVIKSMRDIRVNNKEDIDETIVTGKGKFQPINAQTDETVRRINAIDEGAFQSMLEQPVMQALLIILASIGLFAGEYLKLFG